MFIIINVSTQYYDFVIKFWTPDSYNKGLLPIENRNVRLRFLYNFTRFLNIYDPINSIKCWTIPEPLHYGVKDYFVKLFIVNAKITLYPLMSVFSARSQLKPSPFRAYPQTQRKLPKTVIKSNALSTWVSVNDQIPWRTAGQQWLDIQQVRGGHGRPCVLVS